MQIAHTYAESPDFEQLLSLHPFVFPCPRCGHEFHEALGWFNAQ
jgi:hypothetical protein